MKDAARFGDKTDHHGSINGPGAPKVQIEGMSAAVIGDLHVCVQVPPPAHAPGPFLKGSEKVKIGGKSALREGDMASTCGAAIMNRNGKVKFS